MQFQIKIDSILGGQSTSQYYAGEQQFTNSVGIDPALPIDDSNTSYLPSGVLRPAAYQAISGNGNITKTPLFIQTNPKDNTVFVFAGSGDVHVISASNLTLTAKLSSFGSTEGMAYYQNYMYFAKTADVARYGPLNGSPSFTASYWQGTLGLSALVDQGYPSTSMGHELPIHVMHRHYDALYFCSVSANDQGMLNMIKTSAVSVEGDSNNGSALNVLDFGRGVYPTALETYNTDLAIALYEGTNDADYNQKPAQVAFWNTTASTYSKIISLEFPDPVITAMKNVNGVLYVWSGSLGNGGGTRVSRFAGGYTFEEVAYLNAGDPPLAGAVDTDGARVVWGSHTLEPTASASVFALGAKIAGTGQSLFNVMNTTATGTNRVVTALRYAPISSVGFRKAYPIVGWADTDTASEGINVQGTSYGTSVWRSPMYRIGSKFQIQGIRIPLGKALASNMTITAKLYVDNQSTTYTLPTINSTNYSGRTVHVYKDGVVGDNDFFLELTWSGTALCPVLMPITIDVETEEDNQ